MEKLLADQAKVQDQMDAANLWDLIASSRSR